MENQAVNPPGQASSIDHTREIQEKLLPDRMLVSRPAERSLGKRRKR